MKGIVFVIVLIVAQSFGAVGQDNADDRATEVRKAVARMIAAGDEKVIGVRNDLRVFNGKVIRSDEAEFVIEPKKKTSSRSIENVRFRDVLEIEGKGFLLSYFPDPNQKQFADWGAVQRMHHGDSLEIELDGNQSAFGVLLKTSATDITLIDGNRNRVVGRDQVVRVFLARRDTPGAKRILKGAGKGAGAMKPSGDASSPAAALIDTAIMAGGAAAGAVSAAAKRWPNDRLLIYAR
jgi:hypothetical protein